MATFEELLAQAYGNVVKAGEAITSPEYMKRFPVPVAQVAPVSSAVGQATQLVSNAATSSPDFFGMGIDALGRANTAIGNAATMTAATTGQFDPTTAQRFMNPFQQQVIDEYTKEMQRQFNIQQAGRDAKAVGAGAFGGSRQAVLDAAAATGFQRQLGQGIAGLLSSGFQQAQRAAQQAFENQQRRGQLAAQNLANIGRTQTGIGQVFGQFDPIASGVLERDVSTLARIGATERGIGQAE